MKKRTKRAELVAYITPEQKEQLREISEHHKDKGHLHKSMTHVVGVLIEREFKRLKL